jgi:hypothetical protein
MAHEIRWNAQEWFCARCGRTSDHLIKRMLKPEIDVFPCEMLSARDPVLQARAPVIKIRSSVAPQVSASNSTAGHLSPVYGYIGELPPSLQSEHFLPVPPHRSRYHRGQCKARISRAKRTGKNAHDTSKNNFYSQRTLLYGVCQQSPKAGGKPASSSRTRTRKVVFPKSGAFWRLESS